MAIGGHDHDPSDPTLCSAVRPQIHDVDVEQMCALGRELLRAEHAYLLDPTVENSSRLARARRRLDEAVRRAEGSAPS